MRPTPVMRIPWYFATPLALAVFCTVLWLGARNKDFVTPPSDHEISDSLRQWKAKHPTLPPRERSLPIAPPVEEATAPATPPPTIPHGNLVHQPALDHYSEHLDFSTASYIQLATQLQHKGADAHALLAWERAIDTTDATSAQTAQAHAAIHQLRQSLPAWNIDSSQNFDMVLNIHTPESWKAPVSGLLGELSEDIALASSLIVAPQVLIKTIQQRDGFPPPPVRIWLSSTGEAAKTTPLFTFHPKAEDSVTAQSIKEQLYIAIFRTISAQLDSIDGIMPPAPITPLDSSSTALTTHITRLHWKKLTDSLTVEPPKRAAIIIEEE